MFTMIAFVVACIAGLFGYNAAKRFVRDRLRYVEGAHRPTTPIIAGIGAYLIAALIVGILPIVGIGTAITFALSVAAGAAAGSRDARAGNFPSITSGG